MTVANSGQGESQTSGIRSGQSVLLADLEGTSVDGGPSSVLLDHPLIPVGVRLSVEVVLPSPQVEDYC